METGMIKGMKMEYGMKNETEIDFAVTNAATIHGTEFTKIPCKTNQKSYNHLNYTDRLK